MNDNNAYIVQCTQANFDDARYLVQMFCRVIDIDHKNYHIKTFSLDSTIKRRLDEIGASFWQEPDYAVTKSVMGKRL
ncbi:MAG: hypothetical protein K8R48_08730 [Alphaproteobacteria bacterium]|nr:hypothetical protein [Alphaproteobacteria bacterium]